MTEYQYRYPIGPPRENVTPWYDITDECVRCGCTIGFQQGYDSGTGMVCPDCYE